MARLKVAALGSSFAAGPAIDPIVNAGAQRSGRNYPNQLAQKLDADLTDLTVSGATMLNVLNEAQTTRSGETFPPQLNHLPAQTDIVTLTGGGNDMGYSSGMIYDSAMAYKGPLEGMLDGLIEAPATSMAGQQLTDRFIAVIDKVKEIAPKARIYLVEYIAVFGPATQPNVGTTLDKEAIEQYRERARVLSKAYQDVATARPGVECIAVAKDSEAHCVGSAEPWITGFAMDMFLEGLVPYHPNLAGHTAVAEMVYRRIQAAKDASSQL